MFKDELKQYVLDNPRLVSMKPAGDGIFVLKYKKRVFYDDLWNEFLEHCRGSIVDADFNLVSYRLQKFTIMVLKNQHQSYRNLPKLQRSVR